MYLASLFLSTFLSIFFLIIGSMKTFRWHAGLVRFQLGLFSVYGLSPRIYFLIGVLEILGGFGVLLAVVHLLGIMAAAGLALLSAGAIAYHLRYDSPLLAVPSIMTGLFALVLVAINCAALPPFLSPAELGPVLTGVVDGFATRSGEALSALAGALLGLGLFGLMLTKADGPAKE